MKTTVFLSMLSLTLLTVSCVKTESKKLKVPDIKTKKIEPLKITKKGFRCDLQGTDSKEIFMEIDKKDEKTTVRIHDFLDSGRISLTGGTVEGFTTIAFSEVAVVTEVDTEEQTLVFKGSSSLLKTAEAVLPVDGATLSTKAFLFLNADNTGRIILTHSVKHEDGSFSSEDGENEVTIENCEPFEALWI